MADETNVFRKELGIIGGISLAAGSTIGSGKLYTSREQFVKLEMLHQKISFNGLCFKFKRKQIYNKNIFQM